MKYLHVLALQMYIELSGLLTLPSQEGTISTFKPYSKYPPCYKDVTFWLPDGFHNNDLFEVVRDVAGDLVEEVRQNRNLFPV